MEEAVACHDALLKKAFEEHHGHIFKTIGDAFCAAFHRVSDALAAALTAQRAFKSEDFSAVGDLQIRMALHTGETSERDGDYFGPTVNRVARLLAIGHGGQVLVSGATAELAQGEMPPNASLRDLGAHRLKDLALPEQVYQLLGPELKRDFPPLRSLDSLPNNLPLQVTSFIGREQEVEELSNRFEKYRLLTLAGAGGVGKTRLALQIGAELLDKFADGVWLIELAAIPDPELIPSVVASVLSAPETQGRALSESIINSLRRKQALLIFDNCEHLLDATAKLIDSILRGCPQVRIIATSRQGLDISGESVHRVTSLSLPNTTESLTADAATQHSAIRLFVERAQAANDQFTLTDVNAPAVAQICRRLDGIALAIELAVPRLKVLTVDQLAERMSERFRILTGGSRTALPRQQTMRALIDWSYDLLTNEEKTVFRRAGIFAGGWTLEAISDICADGSIESWALLDLLMSLVGKSLVVAELSGSTPRYRLLESTREYVLAKLRESGEDKRMQQRHAAYFLRMADEADESWSTAPTRAWLGPLEAEIDNFRAALEWTLADKTNAYLGVALAGSLGHLWFDGGLHPEGRHWLNAALAANGDGQRDKRTARLWLALAQLNEARRLHDSAERAREIYEALGDQIGTASALILLSFGLYHLGRREESKKACREALARLQKFQNSKHYAICLARLATVNWADGESARHYHTESLALAKTLGDEVIISLVQSNLAELEFTVGNAELALALATESLPFTRRRKDSRGLALAYGNMAGYYAALGRFEEASASAREAIRWARESQSEFVVAGALESFAFSLQGDLPRTARLIGYVDAQHRTEGSQREPNEARAYAKLTARLKETMDEGEINKLFAEGAAFSEDQAVEEALGSQRGNGIADAIGGKRS